MTTTDVSRHGLASPGEQGRLGSCQQGPGRSAPCVTVPLPPPLSCCRGRCDISPNDNCILLVTCLLRP